MFFLHRRTLVYRWFLDFQIVVDLLKIIIFNWHSSGIDVTTKKETTEKKRCHSQRKQNEFSITIVQNTFLLHRFPPNAYPPRNICVRKTRRRFIIQPCPIFCMTKHCLCTALHIAMHHYNYYTLFFYVKLHKKNMRPIIDFWCFFYCHSLSFFYIYTNHMGIQVKFILNSIELSLYRIVLRWKKWVIIILIFMIVHAKTINVVI